MSIVAVDWSLHRKRKVMNVKNPILYNKFINRTDKNNIKFFSKIYNENNL